MVQTVREFVKDVYKLISADNPTVPLHGTDNNNENQNVAIRILNQLLSYYNANGTMLTINKDVSYSIIAGTERVSFGAPLSGFDVEEGILSYVNNAWLELSGTAYPLTEFPRNKFKQTYRYDPLLGLPLYYFLERRTDNTSMRLYPGASQEYTLNVQGKFSVTELTSNDDMSQFPLYYSEFLKLATAKRLSVYKARSEAWTPMLENMLKDAHSEMLAATPMDLSINSNSNTMLWGASRVRAGV
jgi:hypothetical protein